MARRDWITVNGDDEGDFLDPGAFNKSLSVPRQDMKYTHGEPMGWINDGLLSLRGFNSRMLCEDWELPVNECQVTQSKITMHPETLLTFVTQQFGSDQALRLASQIMHRRIDALFKKKPYSNEPTQRIYP